jgi:hypothetical protein
MISLTSPSFPNTQILYTDSIYYDTYNIS